LRKTQLDTSKTTAFGCAVRGRERLRVGGERKPEDLVVGPLERLELLAADQVRDVDRASPSPVASRRPSGENATE